VTHFDVREFLRLAAEIPLRPAIQEFALEEADLALLELRARSVRGTKVLRMG
jgi:propanol-preferring alcohol dehydrogenase